MPITRDEENQQENRTWLCAVVFLDVVGYTKGSVEQQIKIKDHMNSVVEKSIERVDEIDRIIVDSGDGAAICFLGDPEDSLFCAVKLRDGFDLLSNQETVQYEVCIGINLGPVKVVKDVNNRRNVLGDGINVAQRIMGFAGSGQIFVSRSFYEVISCLSQEYESLFHYQGKKKDKHEREHTVYEFNIPENVAMRVEEITSELKSDVSPTAQTDTDTKTDEIEQPLSANSKTSSTHPGYEWDPKILRTAEDELARQIGPLAKILVKKIATTTNDMYKLYEQLADTITDTSHRDAFLKHMPRVSTIEEYSDPKTIKPDSSSPDTVNNRQWNDQDLEKIEHHLSEYMGPLSKVLVSKAAKKTGDVKELYDMLAQQIDDVNAREAFTKTLARLS